MGIESLGAGADAASINTSAVNGTLGSVGSTPFVSSGPASALSGIISPITGAAESVSSALSGFGGGNKLPLPNPLSEYATYNYIIGLGVLTDSDYNGHTYIKGAQIPLICKSAHIDPENRINTAYGKFDYYIDNLTLEGMVGFNAGKNTNVTTLQFDIIEPYSMGLFMLALQQAAYQSNHLNWRDAPYLLTLEFKGNKETGQMLNIPNTKRYIPIKLLSVQITVKESGTLYQFSAMACQEVAQTVQYNNLRSDASIKGRTVQEVLQTGEKSLETIINQRLKQYKVDKTVEEPDEIVILFPKMAAGSPATNNDNSESNSSATSAPSSGGASIEAQLGVTRDSKTGFLVQAAGETNEIGSSKLGFNPERKADTPIKEDNIVYSVNGNIWDRSKTNIDPELNNFKFAQDSSIIEAINEVLMMSDYPGKVLKVGDLTADGCRKWWRIDVQMFYKSTDANLPKTGTKPKIMVYRIMPYEAHSSAITAPNAKAPGLDMLKKGAVKQYDYIYTGKNSEVLKFDIDFSVGFAATMAADNFKRSQDVRIQNELNISAPWEFKHVFLDFLAPILSGDKPPVDPGTVPTQTRYDSTLTQTDKKGGGGTETDVTRAARIFHDAVTNPNDMMTLNMEIMGDPFWIHQSGHGTYTSSPSGIKNLFSDGTVDYQSGEVHITVNFRTPIDIKQTTGMYDFGGGKTSPVIQFSGVYQVNMVTSYFKQGKFTQVLKGFRRMGQEYKTSEDPNKVFHVDNREKPNEPA